MKTRAQINRKYWKTVVKNNQWFDYSYLYKVMRHQLNFMIINWDKSYGQDAHLLKQEMLAVRDDLDLLIADQFEDKYLKQVDDQYGPLIMSTGQKFPNGTTELLLTRKHEGPDADAAFKQALLLANQDKDNCKARVFNTLRDRIEYWWD